MNTMDKSYQRINTILGWIMGVFASMIYIITSEPTVSFWDCGEYIATAYKLLVGHPPGAPLFQIMGRFFSLFAMGDPALVARMVNTMTALASGFSIMFLFWSITMLTRKLVREWDTSRLWAVMGSGLVGAMAYTFSDSFWFSAVEGEVYGMSSFFTAIVFWAILKWEAVTDERMSLRWLIFIAYMVGLSIGVHLLNLLTIPALALVYYFKHYKKHNYKGILLTGFISFILLALVMNGIIPWIVRLAGLLELLFVNSFGLPFNSGTFFYFFLLIGGIIWGLHYTSKKGKSLANTVIIAFTFLLIGYSSFLMLVIRSNAEPTIDENNPDNAINLLAYLNREQYGDWPILKGQYFNAPVVDREDGNPVYTKDKKSGKYIITDTREGQNPVYDPQFTTLFPRMWSNTQEGHEQAYKNWVQIKGEPIQVPGRDGAMETIYKPTFRENLSFFFDYQLNHMYWRYFMWNFAGRQNDIQGMGRTQNPNGDVLNGNWISGISALDESRLGPQDNLPENLKNKGRNAFYFLPLILGLFGLYYHSRKNYKDGLVVFALFFMTGLAIVLYLNQAAPQPRERDYSYAASFYAFAIWIGIGVFGLVEGLRKLLPAMNRMIPTLVVIVGCTALVPGIMAQQGWDDHDRSGRYTVLEIASNYLNSCAPNAILFTNGDNDTFPLWYAQEVEGIRTDVRVCNLSLLQTDWYVDQMKRKAYDSDPVPFSLPKEKYRNGTLDLVYIFPNPEVLDTAKFYNVKDIMTSLAQGDPSTKFQSQNGVLDYIPTNHFRIPVDKKAVLASGIVSVEDTALIVPSIDWILDVPGITKNHLMVLDLLGSFDWKRPIYFAMTIGDENFLGLQEYFQLEGMAYRLIPIKTPDPEGEASRTNTTVLYDRLMNKFKLDMSNPDLYFSDDFIRMTINMRTIYGRLAGQLVAEGKQDSAKAVIERCIKTMPDKVVPYNYSMLALIDATYKTGQRDKASAMLETMVKRYDEELAYYFRFKRKHAAAISREKEIALASLQRIGSVCEVNEDTVMNTKVRTVFEKYYQMYTGQGQP